MPDVSLVARNIAAAPKDYLVPGAQEFILKAVTANVDGSGAAGTFLPALQMINPAGDVMWTAVARSLPVAAGASANVSWFPGGGVDEAGTTEDVAGITRIQSAGTLTVTNGSGPTTTVDLPASGVTAATYGDATHVAQVTVDAEGRATAASNVAISAGSGTISDITSTGGTITVGSPTGPTTNVDLPNSGVTASTYGDSSNVAQVTVNAKGIVTAASSVSITGSGGVAGADGWVTDTNSPTYASATTFTAGASDLTAVYSPGTRIKLTQTTVKYFVVASSSFGAGTTTVTITAGTDYTLANAAITNPFYSYMENPQGYPGWFNYTCNATGFSSKTSDVGKFAVSGRVCTVLAVIFGTSNATTLTCDAPIAAIATRGTVCLVTDNGTTALGRSLVAASTLSGGITFSLGLANAAGDVTYPRSFVNSGTKGCNGNLAAVYDI